MSVNEYNGLNQLVNTTNIKNGERTFASYLYDGDGLRVQKTVDGKTTDYVYSGNNVIAETGKTYLRGLSYHAVTKDDGTYYYFCNAHGDVTGVVDEGGNVAATYDYDEFGNLTEETGNFNNDIKYSGEFYASESENYYLRSRYYDPTIGRFTQQDSFLGVDNNPLSLNRYTYCHNNPIRFVDPSGYYTEFRHNIEGFGTVVYDGEFASSAADEEFGRYLYQFKQGQIGYDEFFRQTSTMGVNVGIENMYYDTSETSMLDVWFGTAVSYDTAMRAVDSITETNDKYTIEQRLGKLSSGKIAYDEISACIDNVHFNSWIPYLAGLYGGTAVWDNTSRSVKVSVGGKTVEYKAGSRGVSLENGKMYVCTDKFFADFDVQNVFGWEPDAEYGYAAYINLDEKNRRYCSQLYGIQLNTDYTGKYKVLSGEVVNDILIGSTYQDEYYFYGASSDRVLAFCYPLTEQNKITNNVYYADIGSLVRNGYGDGENYITDFILTRINVAKEGAYISEMLSRDSERVRKIAAGYMAIDIINGTFIQWGSSIDKSAVVNFKSTDQLRGHYMKHGQQISKSLNLNRSYTMENYLNDANYVIQNGTYVPELNGYIRFIDGNKYGFVGLDRATGSITTFHIKTVEELAKYIGSGLMK